MNNSLDIELIVIATTKTGESSLVLHTISKEFGRRSFITSIGKNSRMSMFLPLNIIHGRININSKSTLSRISRIQSAFPLNSIRSNLDKNTITLFISEVLYRSIKDGSNEDLLYEWCKSKILELDALENDYASFHLLFLVELCEILGFKTTLESLTPFAGSHFENISELLALDKAEFLLYPLNGKNRNEIAEALLEYLSYHLDCHLNIRSLKVLRELYA